MQSLIKNQRAGDSRAYMLYSKNVVLSTSASDYTGSDLIPRRAAAVHAHIDINIHEPSNVCLCCQLMRNLRLC